MAHASTAEQTRSAVSSRSAVVTPTEFGVPGKIKFFNPGRGYGFIICEIKTEDVYLSAEVLEKCGLKRINNGHPVLVTFGRGPNGWVATAIKLNRMPHASE